MKLNEYQNLCNRRDGSVMYPSHLEGNIESISYCSLSLCGEAGEVANKVKKILRGDTPLTLGEKHKLAKELSGAFWYLSMLSLELGYTLEELAKLNIETINSRLARNVLRGDGDDR